MGTFEQDPNPDPSRSVPIGWLFDHVLPQVPAEVRAAWAGTVHGVIGTVRDAWGVASSLDTIAPPRVQGLDRHQHSLTELRFYRTREGDAPIPPREAHAMRHDLGLAYGTERALFQSDIPGVPEGITQLVLPPETEPLLTGTLWVPGMEDLVIVDWTARD